MRWLVILLILLMAAALAGGVYQSVFDRAGDRAPVKRVIEKGAEIAGPAKAPGDVSIARNVIYFIADGMGTAHVTAARIFAGGAEKPLALESMPVTGFARTWSSDGFVTDSAASATALASGVKTYNGAIGMSDAKIDPTGASRPLQQLTDLAAAKGKAVGVITTARVTHATPACFYARAAHRDQEAEIADQLGTSTLRLLLGGGREWFHPTLWRDPETSGTGERKDGRDLVVELRKVGWSSVETRAEFEALDPAAPGLRLLGLFNADHMQYELERGDDRLGEPSLAEMVDFAIEMLGRDPEGYFLMVEAGRIDHASHANDIRNAVGDVTALDRAIATALAKAGKNTLIVLTADHETGGLALNGYGPLDETRGEALLQSAEPDRNVTHIVAWGSGRGMEAGGMFRHHAAYTRSSAEHTAVDVPIVAAGPGAARFTGYMNNSQIAWKIAEAMGTTFTAAANESHREGPAGGK